MTIVQCIEKIAEWLNKNVCPKIKLKRPNDEEQGDTYSYEEVNPTAFPMLLPGNDKLAAGTDMQFPSILVQLLEGAQDLTKSNDRMNLQLSFVVWNPGAHSIESETGKFQRSADGWKDVWSFLDRTLAEIENAEYLDGLRFVKEAGVKYGQYTKDGQIADTYPYFYAWATITIERGLNRTGAAYSEHL